MISRASESRGAIKPQSGRIKPQTILGGSDQRWRVGYPTSSTGGYRPFGFVNTGCTCTLIGRSTALTAAHCLYDNAAWKFQWPGSLPGVGFGAERTDPAPGVPIYPFGTQSAGFVVPNEWIAPQYLGIKDWEYDFAILEFSPNAYPGDSTGWYGTTGGYPAWLEWHGRIGFPGMYGLPAMYMGAGQNGYSYYGDGMVDFWWDTSPGDSGGAFWRASDNRVFMLTSQAHATFNTARKWDSTTYAFFDAYANWP